MEVIKKITILAVLIASVVVIITFSPNIYEGIATNIEARQYKKLMGILEAESQAESDAYWAEQARLNSLAEARWNLLTQEEKCEESREEFYGNPNPNLRHLTLMRQEFYRNPNLRHLTLMRQACRQLGEEANKQAK